tara:strand:- start:7 stop:501 length:495 start_codon:yes stop_codon:yes gene_type:complete
MTRECMELNNIKYKTMLLNKKTTFNLNDHVNSDNINNFLDKETCLNEKLSWTKLDKTSKFFKIKNYISSLTDKYSLTESEIAAANKEMLNHLNKKRLYKVKDVDYNVTDGIITNIASLHFNKELRKFTLKKCERRTSTLKSLAPKRRAAKTLKNLEKIDTHIKD